MSLTCGAREAQCLSVRCDKGMGTPVFGCHVVQYHQAARECPVQGHVEFPALGPVVCGTAGGSILLPPPREEVWGHDEIIGQMAQCRKRHYLKQRSCRRPPRR